MSFIESIEQDDFGFTCWTLFPMNSKSTYNVIFSVSNFSLLIYCFSLVNSFVWSILYVAFKIDYKQTIIFNKPSAKQ